MGGVSRFTEGARLATGGMADVLAGEEIATGAPVVRKRLHAPYAADPIVQAMFAHEARVLAALDHPLVPRLYEATTIELVMERIAGHPLREDGAAPRVLSWSAWRKLADDVLEALVHVHERCDALGVPLEIVHRDVTPSNLLVTPEGRVRLVDYGIASSRDASGRSSRGTPGYMAPEAIVGGVVDARADLFALGVVLWEHGTGVRLFPGPLLATMDAVVEGTFVPMATIRSDTPPALDTWLAGALARPLSDRYPSARAMRVALADARNASP